MRARLPLLLAAAALAVIAAWVLLPRATQPEDQEWRNYKQRFLLAEGRITESGGGPLSRSEAQGYAMVLATAYHDKPAFDSLWGWTSKTLRQPDGLFGDGTDGDLTICWALLRAAELWNRPEDRDAALDVARALRREAVASEAGNTYVLPRAGSAADGKKVVNLSYWVFPALRDIAVATGDPAWREVIDTGLTLIGQSRFGDHKLPPDWLETAGTLRPAEGFPPRFGADAGRIPLYLLWADMGGSEQLEAIDDYWKSTGDKSPAWIDLTTAETSPSRQSPGMSAVRDLALGQPLPPAAHDDDLYSATLWMLAKLAKAEYAP